VDDVSAKNSCVGLGVAVISTLGLSSAESPSPWVEMTSQSLIGRSASRQLQKEIAPRPRPNARQASPPLVSVASNLGRKRRWKSETLATPSIFLRRLKYPWIGANPKGTLLLMRARPDELRGPHLRSQRHSGRRNSERSATRSMFEFAEFYFAVTGFYGADDIVIAKMHNQPIIDLEKNPPP
jgi:hypothetical protein